MDNDIWSFGEITYHMRDEVLVSETPHCGNGVVYHPSFKDAMLITATISCCGYRNGVKKDQWKKDSKTTRASTFCSYT
jgi:hypothetical protein